MEKKTKKFNKFYLVLIAILAFSFLYMGLQGTGKSGKEINYSEAYILISNDEISDVWRVDGNFKLRLRESKISKKDFPKNADLYFSITDTSELQLLLELINEKNSVIDEKINISYTATASVDYWSYIMPVLYVGGVAFLLFFVFKMMNRSNNSAMSFGKSRARQTNEKKVKFDDIAGAEEEKEELAEIVEFLKNPNKFKSLGARIPKGVLLVGNPGTGKTLLARAVAGESNVPFLSISGSDFVEMFVGVGASRVRDLFEQAKRNGKCIVFIDEIDAVGRQRGAGLGGGNDEREQTLNQLLVEMDGFEANEGIIVLAATNRSDVLDPALMRPGRFDRQIYVHAPDVRGREGILKIHARNKPIDEEVDFKTIARITSGFTGADIENMLNEAAILAARKNRAKIIMEDITEGINKVMMGPQKKSLLVTDKDKKITAYHESGHAILGKKLEHCEEVQEVSIIPRGMAAGYTMSRPDSDDNHLTYGKLNDEIAMIMGGRIAEELFMDDISTGASNDIQRATEIARKMVTQWGMSKKFGFMNLGTSEEIFVGRDYRTKTNYSEKTSAEIDGEIQKILKDNYERAKEIIEKNKKYLVQMAEILLEKETIYTEEVDMIMDGKSTEEIINHIDKKIEEQKEKDEKLKKEQEIIREIMELEQRMKTAQFYLKEGRISQKDYDRIESARNEMLAQINKEKENLESNDAEYLQEECKEDAKEVDKKAEEVDNTKEELKNSKEQINKENKDEEEN